MQRKIFGFVMFLMFGAAISAQTKPLTVGETLVYEGKLSKIVQGISVAEMTFSLNNAPNGKDYLLKTEARSKGSLLKLFRYSFLQQYESIVDANNFRILKTVKHDVQKDRIRDSEAVFDYKNKQVTFSETNPKEAMRPPRKIASDIPNDAQDLISAIYLLRTIPLTVGKTFVLNISDSGLVYKVPVHVTKRELQKTILGKMMCFRIEPEIFGTNRLIEQEGSIVIWITDDTRRVPVRSQINNERGKIEIKLKQLNIAAKQF